MGSSLTPETAFLRYAFPCAHLIREDNRISDAEFEELHKGALGDLYVAREKIEGIFKQGIRRLKETAEREGLEYWSVEAIRTYFRDYHEEYIEANDGTYKIFPQSLKELCKVKKAKIDKMVDLERRIAEVEIDGKKRPVFLELIEDADVGDEVYVHYAYAVEKA